MGSRGWIFWIRPPAVAVGTGGVQQSLSVFVHKLPLRDVCAGLLPVDVERFAALSTLYICDETYVVL